jgi:hypothetical protein
VLAATASVLVAACGGGGEKTVTEGPAPTGGKEGKPVEFTGNLASAATENCNKVESGRLRMSWQVSGGGLPSPVEATFTGEFDNKAKRSHLNMDLAPLFKALGESGGGEAGAAAAAGAGTLEIVTDGDTTYVKSALFGALLGAGEGKWVKFTAGGGAGSAGFTQNLFGGDVCDFTGVLSAVGDVRRVGTETIDGVATVHFQAVVDLTKAASAAGASAEGQESFKEFIAGSGLEKVPVEVWVGSDGIFRRVRITLENFDLGQLQLTGATGAPTGSAPTKKVKLTMTISFTDVNERVTVELPPAGQVVEPGGLFGSIPSIPDDGSTG